MAPTGRALVAPAEALRQAEALFFVENLDTPKIRDEDLHHLLDVLHPRVGEHLALSDGRGAFRIATIAGLPMASRRTRGVVPEPGELSLEFDVVHARAVERTDELTVAFAIPKSDRLDLVVQKLTELGIDRIVPLITRRTVVRLDARDRARRRERLDRVAREACSQSRRLELPEVVEPLDLAQFLAHAPLATVFAEPGGAGLDPAVRCVIIGPEGGFDPTELPEDAQFLGLGGNILRVETAAIASATLLSALRAGVIGAS